MTRIAMICITLSVLAGALYLAFNLEFKKAYLAWKMYQPGKVVYATQDIAKGSVINADSIIEKQIEQSRIPSAAVTESKKAVWRKARYGISRGQILSLYDLDPPPLEIMSVCVRAQKDISEGSVIHNDDVANVYVEKTKLFSGKGLSKKKVIGKKAKYQISEGTILSKSDFEP